MAADDSSAEDSSAGPIVLVPETVEELYDEAPCGYLSALPDGTIARVNAWVTRKLGREKEELVGRVRLQELFTVGGRIYWETHVQPLLAMQGFVEEIALELAAERRLPILLHATLRRSPTGQPLGMRAVLIDVTERRRYERELLAARDAAEEAARARGTLMAMISHDIRNPLSSLVTASQLLEQTALDGTQQKCLDVIRRSASTITALVDQALDMGQLEAGHQRLELAPLDPRALVESIAAEQSAKAEAKGIALDVEVDPSVPSRVLGDGIKLGRVLGNLVGNAVKFTEEGHVAVALEAEQADDERVTLRFEVRDTGVGIEPDALGHIFDDFRQGSEEIRRRFGGSGLGLGICRRLLALHRSELQVASTPGEGSSFSFELRARTAPAED